MMALAYLQELDQSARAPWLAHIPNSYYCADLKLKQHSSALVHDSSSCCSVQLALILHKSCLVLCKQCILRRALVLQDPSVMSAALCALYETIKQDPLPYKNLVPSFISILKQVNCCLSTLSAHTM